MPNPPLRRTWPLLATLQVAAPFASGTAVSSPLGGGDSVTLEPAPATAAAGAVVARRKVYTCVTPGLVTFSDRPCGPLPQVREIRVERDEATQPGTGSGGAATDGGPASPGTARRRAGADPEDAPDRAAQAHASTCQRLEQALRGLDERLRSGYSAREAGRLWARWREARDRLREARC